MINASGILITLVLFNLPTKIISLVDADCRPIECSKKISMDDKTLKANVLLLLSLWKFSVLYAACPAKLSVKWFCFFYLDLTSRFVYDILCDFHKRTKVPTNIFRKTWCTFNKNKSNIFPYFTKSSWDMLYYILKYILILWIEDRYREKER